MSLRARLTTLRQQSGAAVLQTALPAAEPGASAPAPLRQRLARVSVGVGRQHTTQSQRIDEQQLAELLGGRLIGEGLIEIEQWLATDATHAGWCVGDALEEALAFFGYPAPGQAVVFMDTETTGLAGGTGTVVFLLGLARLQPDGFQLKQYFLTGFSGETALLQRARQFIEDATVLVSYNGKCFDQPLLQTRYRLARLDDPFAALQHWDLLPGTRRAFARHWPDCRLHTVEQRLLAFQRDNDLPGSEVPETWFRWVRQGIGDDLPRVVRHNYWDLLSLAALLARLPQCYQAPLQHQADILAAARHYLDRDDEAAAWEHLLAHRDQLDARAALELAGLARRRRQWPLALEIWRELAQNGNGEALLRLAKYYEHVAGELPRALRCTRALLKAEPRCEPHRQRERRLLVKLERLSSTDPN